MPVQNKCANYSWVQLQLAIICPASTSAMQPNTAQYDKLSRQIVRNPPHDVHDVTLTHFYRIRLLHNVPDFVIQQTINLAQINRDIELYVKKYCEVSEEAVSMFVNVYNRYLLYSLQNLENIYDQYILILMFKSHAQVLNNVLNYFSSPRKFINEYILFKWKVSVKFGNVFDDLPNQIVKYRDLIEFSNFFQIVEGLFMFPDLYFFGDLKNQLFQSIEYKIQNFYNKPDGQSYGIEVQKLKDMVAKIIHNVKQNVADHNFFNDFLDCLLRKPTFMHNIINILKRYGHDSYIMSFIEAFIMKGHLRYAIVMSHYCLLFFSTSLSNLKIDELIDKHPDFAIDWADQLVEAIRLKTNEANYMNDEPLTFLIFNKLLLHYNFGFEQNFVNLIYNLNYESSARKFSNNDQIKESIQLLFYKNINDHNVGSLLNELFAANDQLIL